ncbi:putative AP-3 complex subunit delta [Glarea lozoyensis 74030]|uniref:Putative AP-3 complex subunit delta n=1 Tax=Glarea lozoyensis (strain ATCC 74030 / MF5533) TaxID=1104152 RepID=H0EUA0_GLAL7|nr:putative AP-3 complex subunit delta [Glarea lozoyensis 74030]
MGLKEVSARFEKSLYDLIRGLRNHKGNEKEYIQNSLKECRAEIKGSDMDLKATALLKLVYLEMFGHDMSWASFHVLEVMSSPKYLQKRVGYLGAVQSFRPDTEVLIIVGSLGSSPTTDALPSNNKEEDYPPRLFELLVDGGNNWMAIKLIKLIVVTHPYLVAQQEDVIMECIDSSDISIRLRALDLVVGMTLEEANERPVSGVIEPIADSDDETPEVTIRPDRGASQEPLLPDDYKIDVISRILEMCASNNYGNLEDFDCLLRAVDSALFDEPDGDEFETYYYRAPPSAPSVSEPAANRLGGPSEEAVQSYQHGSEESYLDPDIVARRRAERLERNKDDPFYIAPVESSGTSTPLHNILQSNNGPDLDLDAIPIMQLKLDGPGSEMTGQGLPKKRKPPKAHQRIQVAADETLGSGSTTPKFDDSENSFEGAQRARPKGKQSLLQVDSSHIGAFSLEGDGSATGIDFERQQREEAEMAKAMKEVDRLRLEMQRANERIQAAQGVSLEGTVVKKKTKKKAKPVEGESVEPVKKKKAKKAVIDEGQGEASNVAEVVKPKKKKKKPKVDQVNDQPETLVQPNE